MSKQLGIPEEQLRACLQDQYELYPVTLTFLPLGHDYDAGIYRVESEQGTAFALKVTRRSLYEPRYLVPRYLNDQGIASVVAPISTRSRTLWASLAVAETGLAVAETSLAVAETRLSDWTVTLYPWISGDSSLTGMTDEQWKQVGTIFHQIHQVRLPPAGFASLRKETFDPTEYVRWVRAFEAQHGQTQGQRASERALRTSWIAHQSTIHTAVTSLEKLAAVLQSRSLLSVICHGDLHARNLIRKRAGQVFVVDWDEVLLAPKERDFIFVRKPYADAFFQGYGDTEIDGMLLSYYLWERVVQDLIEDAHNVCFRDDLGEETKAQIVQVFHKSLESRGSNLHAAYEASTHLAI
jgi:spectinomycin phosphotransferase